MKKICASLFVLCILTNVWAENGKLFFWEKERGIRIPDAVSSSTIFRDNKFCMYYTAQEGIHLAISQDGIHFREFGPVITHSALGTEQEFVSNPGVFQMKNGKYRMLYEGSRNRQRVRKLFSAVSDNGLKWTKEPGIRLEDGMYYSDPKKGKTGYVTFASVPDVIRLEDGSLRMYYTVIDQSRIASSTDEGLTWHKEGRINFDVQIDVVQDPDVIQLEDKSYKLFFSTQDFFRTRQWIVSATSDDGINFTLDKGERILPSRTNSRAVDPDVIEFSAGDFRMYYGESSDSRHFDIFSATSTVETNIIGLTHVNQ